MKTNIVHWATGSILLLSLIATSGCEERLDLNNMPNLPPHWHNLNEQGIDSRVGHFASTEVPLVIQYDIGKLAGEYANSDAHPNYQRLENANLHGNSFKYLLDEDNTLYVTFPNEGPANFWVKISNDADIDYVFELLARYRHDLLES